MYGLSFWACTTTLPSAHVICSVASEVLQLHGLCLGEVLVSLRHIQTIESGLRRGMRPVKKKDVCCDRGVFLYSISFPASESDFHNLHFHHSVSDLCKETEKAADGRVAKIVVS